MSALTLVLQELPGVDIDEFRNLRSYYACGKLYKEALKGKNRKRSCTSACSTKSISSGVSSLSDDEIAKSLTETTTLPCDKEITQPSTTTSKSNETDDGIGSPSEEESSTSEFHTNDEKEAPTKANIAEDIAKRKVTCTTNRRIMYRGRDILNLERNAQPHKWQLTSPLYDFYQRCIIYKKASCPDNLESFQAYKMKTCNHCDFYEPASNQYQ